LSEEGPGAQSVSESAEPSQQRFWLPRLLVLGGAILFGLVALEVLLQLFYVPPANIRFKQDVQILTEMGMNRAATILEHDDELFWRLKRNVAISEREGSFFGLISNNQGFREDHEIPIPKPAGQKRILFLGDSCTFGFGVEHTESFVNRSEGELRKKFPDRDWECINAGVPAYTLFQGWRYLMTEGFDLNPDMVVVCFGGAEPTPWDGISDLEHYDHWLASRPAKWLQWSRICQITCRAMAPRPKVQKKAWGKMEKKPRLSPFEFQQLLNKICHQSSERRIPVVFLVWPFRVQVDGTEASHTLWQQVPLAMKNRPEITVVDLSLYFREAVKTQDVGELFIDRGHTTAKGHVVVAQGVVEAVERHLVDEQ